jgi:hypothetical protein
VVAVAKLAEREEEPVEGDAVNGQASIF